MPHDLLDERLHSDDFVDEEPVSVVVSIDELHRLGIERPKAKGTPPAPIQAVPAPPPSVALVLATPVARKVQAIPAVPKVRATPPTPAAGVALRARLATLVVMLAIALCACVMLGMLMLSA